MSFKYNGTSIESVVFNDERITQLYYNDTLMWENPLFYNLLDDGSGYSVRLGNSNVTGDIMIAEMFNGKPVVAIENNAFKGASGITSLYVPSSITSYGNRFLEGCSGLTNLTLPFIDKALGRYFGALQVSSNENYVPAKLKNVIITGGTSICNSAFFGCKDIVSVRITGTNITNIGEDAFYLCRNLKEVNIPSNVTNIGDNAFTGCKELITIIIPNSVATIGGNAFGNCSKATIYCKATSQPSGWHSKWNGVESIGNTTTAYFYTEHTSSVGNGTYWHYVNGTPVVWSHSYNSVVTAPTCTALGYTTYTCSVCGRVYKSDYVAAEHIESNWIIDVKPTTTTTGSYHTECTSCGITLDNGTLPKRLKEPPYEYYAVTNYGTNDDGKIELRAYARNINDSDVDCYVIVFDSNGVSYSTQRFTIAADEDYSHSFLVSSSFDGSTFEMYFTANGYSNSESVLGIIS